MKKGFTLYNDSLDVFDGLTDEQIGKLMRAIRDFNRGIEPVLEGMLAVIFIPFKNQFLRQGIGKSALEISEINKRNRNLRTTTKHYEFNESNEFVHISKSISKSNSNSKSNVGGMGEKYPFDNFWIAYDKKEGRVTCEKKWQNLTDEEKGLIMIHVPNYVVATPDKKYRKMPATYLNQKTWLDEELPVIQTKPKSAWA